MIIRRTRNKFGKKTKKGGAWQKKQHQCFAGMLGGKVGKGFYKHLVLFQAGLHDHLADKAGVAGGHQPGPAHHGAGDMIFHKETARHAVHIGIAAQKNR